MKIAMMTNNYLPFIGGVPVSVERLTTELRVLGHEVTVFAPEYDNCPEQPGVLRYKATSQKTDSGVAVPDMMDKKIRDEFHRQQFDLVHVHHPMLIGHTGMALAKYHKLPIAFTYHTRYEQYLHHLSFYSYLKEKQNLASEAACSSIQKLVELNNRLFINGCDIVFAPTPLIKEMLEENGAKSEIKVLPTGLADEDFAYSRVLSKEVREKYSRGKKHLFCCVARLEKEKNLEFLMSAMAKYKAMAGDNFQLIIIGDGSARAQLEQYARSINMQDSISFTGSVDRRDMSSYYNACDLFVFSSRSETQGIVLLEAMAAGLPVVAVEASGVCDVVEDGVNGYKTAHDQLALAMAVQKVFVGEREYKKLSCGARKTARLSSAEQVAKMAQEAYLRIITRHKSSSATGKRMSYDH